MTTLICGPCRSVCRTVSYLFKCSQQYVRVAEMLYREKRKWTRLESAAGLQISRSAEQKARHPPSPSSTTACTTMGKTSLSMSYSSWGERPESGCNVFIMISQKRSVCVCVCVASPPPRRPTRWGWRCVRTDRTAGTRPSWSAPSQTAESCPGEGNCTKHTHHKYFLCLFNMFHSL